MRKVCMIIGLALFATMLFGTANGDTMEHSSMEDLNGGKFWNTELTGSGADAAVALKALGGPDWDQIETEIPARAEFGMAYDQVNEALVIFGGEDWYTEMAMGDTWAYNIRDGTWEQMNPTIAPPGRHGHEMVYDPARELFVMFGGDDGKNYLGDTWTYDLQTNTWEEVTPEFGPRGRVEFSMVYDTINEKILLFGGETATNTVLMNDTWVFDTERSIWTSIHTNGAPSARKFHAAAFDEDEGVMVMFSGSGPGSGNNDDTWEYDPASETWTNITSASDPTPADQAAMSYIGNGQILLFGGSVSGTPAASDQCWRYNASADTWTVGSKGPSYRDGSELVYDEPRGRALLFGGRYNNEFKDLWECEADSGNWTKLWDRSVPTPRGRFGFVYDEINDRCILFGGLGSDYTNDTWEYDPWTLQWRLIDTPTAPSPRSAFGMVYDSVEGIIVLFGGKTLTTNYLSDTWEFNVLTDEWTLTTTSGPNGRNEFCMAYDPGDTRTVLFGGSSSNATYASDTWEYDSVTDTWASGGTGPTGRYRAAAAYHEEAERIVMFGGYGSAGILDDTWEYDAGTNSWTQPLIFGSGPEGRYDHAMSYDPVEKRLIVYGGYNGTYLNYTWLYRDIGASRQWGGTYTNCVPEPRSSHKMAYVHSRMTTVMFGGWANVYLDDIWEFSVENDRWTAIRPNFFIERTMLNFDFDTVRDRGLIYGANWLMTSLLWTMDPEDADILPWDHSGSSYAPYPYRYSISTFDPNGDQFIVFGGEAEYGSGTIYDNTTWLFSFNSGYWEEISPTTAPVQRQYGAMAYDRSEGKAVLFGGKTNAGGSSHLNDTWTFDPTQDEWKNVSSYVAPSRRWGHIMEYDHVNKRVIVHGGWDNINTEVLGDTWAYYIDNNTWIEVSHGPRLYAHGSTVDTTRDRMIVFAGNDDEYGNRLYAYYFKNDTWVMLNTPTAPSARAEMDIAYSAGQDAVFMVGGRHYLRGNPYYAKNVWRLNMEGHQTYGTYTSEALSFDGKNVAWKTISWDLKEEDDRYAVMAQVAVDDDGVTGEFVGPDGTATSYFTEGSGEHLDPGITGEYLRYRFYLRSSHSGMTPEIDSVVLTYKVFDEPSVVLHSPNGGEDLIENGSHVITWTAAGEIEGSSVQLAYTIDGGTSWTNITTGVENKGYYNWTVPTVESGTALVRITVTDIIGQFAEDVSDMTFAIDPPANWMIPGTGGQSDGDVIDDPVTPGRSDDDAGSQGKDTEAGDHGLEPAVITGGGIALILMLTVLMMLVWDRQHL